MSPIVHPAPGGSGALHVSRSVWASVRQTVPDAQLWFGSGAEQELPSGIGKGRARQVPAQQPPPAGHCERSQLPWSAHSSLKKQLLPGGSVPENTSPQIASSRLSKAASSTRVQSVTPAYASMHLRAACPS